MVGYGTLFGQMVGLVTEISMHVVGSSHTSMAWAQLLCSTMQVPSKTVQTACKHHAITMKKILFVTQHMCKIKPHNPPYVHYFILNLS
jgi:hypothetical protein